MPTLVAHSAVRYEEWCDVVAGFAAGLGGAPGDLAPQTVARAALGAAMAAFARGPVTPTATWRPRWTGRSGCWPPDSTHAGIRGAARRAPDQPAGRTSWGRSECITTSMRRSPSSQ